MRSVSDKRVTVGDVLDDPQLQKQVAAISHEGDLLELTYCQQRGLPVSKTLWRRIMRYRRTGEWRRRG